MNLLNKAIDLFLDKFIFRKKTINPHQKEIARLIIYLLIVIFIFVMLFTTFISFRNVIRDQNNIVNRMEDNVSATPTLFDPTPLVTLSRNEFTKANQVNEIALNDHKLKYSIVIKKETEIKLINLMQVPIGLKVSDGREINIPPGDIRYVFFSKSGDYVLKDIRYGDRGFVINVKVVE